MHFHPSCVADNLEDETADHANQEAPCPVPNPKPYLEAEQQGKDGEIQRVAGERGDVVDVGQIQRTCADGAEVGVVGNRVAMPDCDVLARHCHGEFTGNLW